MPRMDGLTFLDRVGAVAPALRSIVITAYGDMANIRQAMNAGAFDFLTKPLDFADLETTLEKAAQHVRQVREALRSIEENQTLRMFVDPMTLERLVPFLRTSTGVAAESIEATIALISICGDRDDGDGDDSRRAIELINHNHDLITAAVHGRRGRVVRFLGDALIVMFHGGDHRERAVHACCAVRNELIHQATKTVYGLEIRAGLGSGRVVCGSVGSSSQRRFDYAVLGRPVQIARTLEAMADEGQILITDPLRESLEGMFHWRKSGKRLDNGSDPALEVYDIIAPQVQDQGQGGSTRIATAETCTEVKPGDKVGW